MNGSGNKASPVLLAEEIFSTPDHYVGAFECSAGGELLGAVELIRMTRSTYSLSSFLDERIVPAGARQTIDASMLLKLYQDTLPSPRPICFVFHSAFCCSTLLARCLDIPGSCLALKEPIALTQLAKLRNSFSTGTCTDQEPYDSLLKMLVTVMSRSYSSSEVSLVKLHNACNNMMPDILSMDWPVRGLFMYSDLRTFLISTLKSEERRGWVRSQLSLYSPVELSLPELIAVKTDTLNDAEVAAYLWLINMYSYLEFMADKGKKEMPSLNCDLFLAKPAETLKALGRHFGLSLPDAAIENIHSNLAISRHAKAPDTPYSIKVRNAEKKKIGKMFHSEISHGLWWAKTMSKTNPVPDRLPNALL